MLAGLGVVGNIYFLRGDFKKVEDRLTKVEGNLSKVNGNLSDTEDRLTKVEGNLLRVNANLTATENNLTESINRLWKKNIESNSNFRSMELEISGVRRDFLFQQKRMRRENTYSMERILRACERNERKWF